MKKNLLLAAIERLYQGLATLAFAGAVVAVKSTSVTNLDATPRTLMPARLMEGRAQVTHDYVAVANGDSIASVYRAVRVSTSDIVDSLAIDCDAITSAAADIGCYDTAENGGAVIDADLFASAQSIATALRATDVTRESGVITVANMGKQLWELLGYTTDPRKLVDIALTLTAAATAAGNVAVKASIRKGN